MKKGVDYIGVEARVTFYCHDEIGWFKLDNLPTPLHSKVEAEIKKYKQYLV